MQFSDVTEESGVGIRMQCGASPSTHILEVDGGGVALFDYDTDGDLDMFVANGATLSHPSSGPGSRLYANNGSGRFSDATDATGLSLTGWAMGVAVGDYNDDGAEDVYVTRYGRDVLLKNEAGRRFVDMTSKVLAPNDQWGTSASFFDIEQDGDLDLYVTNYLEFNASSPPSHRSTFKGVSVMPGPRGMQPQGDLLLENLGDGRFTDATSSRGIQVANPGYGLGVVAMDADADGDQDLFVGNDSTHNFLFINNGQGHFQESALISGVATNADGAGQACMGIGLADIDGNTYPDLFVTNFSNDTNTLYLNSGSGFFDDGTSRFGLAMSSLPYLGWGTGFYDFDLDGDEDLFIANGHVYPEATMMSMDSEYEQLPLLYERKGRRFHRSTEAGRMFKTCYRGRATAFGDLDDDGDVDIVMTTLNGPVHVFRNEAPPRAVVVVQPLRKTGGAALGSMVELVAGDTVQRRWIDGGSFQSSDAPIAYFGLGDVPADTHVTVRVTWSGGEKSECNNLPINRRIVVQRGVKEARVVALKGRASSARAQPDPKLPLASPSVD